MGFFCVCVLVDNQIIYIKCKKKVLNEKKNGGNL